MKQNDRNIDHLIIGYLTNDISPEELETLNTWKNLNQKNQEEFEQLESVWIKSECLKNFRQIDTQNDWNCIYNKVKSKKENRHRLKHFALSAQKIAAIFIPLFFIAVSGLLYWNVPGFGRLSAYETSSHIKKIDLPDGSKVTLNSNSKIVYPRNIASADIRNIELSGEAYFEVSHNNTPFHVQVKQATITVLGTQFNVEQHKADVYVSVISGKVSVTANHNEVQLTKGERVALKQGRLIEEQAETENDIYWCSKKLKFKQAKLTSICKELQNNFAQIKAIKYNTSDLNTKVTTTFREQSLQEILEELEIHFNKKITFDGTTLTVSD